MAKMIYLTEFGQEKTPQGSNLIYTEKRVWQLLSLHQNNGVAFITWLNVTIPEFSEAKLIGNTIIA